MKTLLKKIISGGTLSEREAFDMVGRMAQQETPSCAGAILAALAMRGESVSELIGCVRYLRQNMIELPVHQPCADIVGTGGDGLHSFNISTTAALVAAGAGVRVAKHGNRAVSSSCGAADVLEMLGIKLEKTPEELIESVEKHGFSFLFARNLHPVMAKVAPLRQELGIRTVFNLAGPLANPARPEYVVAGVYDAKLLSVFAEVLERTGVKHALVVHSTDGMDEISSLVPTEVIEYSGGQFCSFLIEPEIFLVPEECCGTLAGGTPEHNSRILTDILSGIDRSAKRGAVLLNAAALCMVSGVADNFKEGVALARKSIDSGVAMVKLEEARQ